MTHRDRDSLVIISADEYRRLKTLDSRNAAHLWELPDDLARALETAAPPEFTRQFDSET